MPEIKIWQGFDYTRVDDINLYAVAFELGIPGYREIWRRVSQLVCCALSHGEQTYRDIGRTLRKRWKKESQRKLLIDFLSGA